MQFHKVASWGSARCQTRNSDALVLLLTLSLFLLEPVCTVLEGVVHMYERFTFCSVLQGINFIFLHWANKLEKEFSSDQLVFSRGKQPLEHRWRWWLQKMGLWAPADILLKKKLNALWLLKIIIYHIFANRLIKKKRERRDNRSLLDIHAISTRTVLSVISPWSSDMCRERTLSCVSNEPNTSSTIVAAYESTVFGYNPDTKPTFSV